MGFKDIFKRSENPFFNKEKRADFERLRKAGYSVKTAKALVDSNPKYQDDEKDYDVPVKKKKSKSVTTKGVRITAKRPRLK